MTKRLFNEIVSWQDATFPKATAYSILKHLEKEIRELRDEIEKDSTVRVEAEMFEELADCFILMFGIAGSFKMSYEELSDVIFCKLMKNKSREWGEPDKDGVVLHKKTKQ